MDFHDFSFRVRYGETDQMGVVHHGNYPQYLEMGRVEWLRSLGVSYKSMEENGIMLTRNFNDHKLQKIRAL